MKKRWQVFFFSGLLVLLLVIAIPFADSQQPEQCKNNLHPVTLGGETLFSIGDQKKADKIENIIQIIADDFTIATDTNEEKSDKVRTVRTELNKILNNKDEEICFNPKITKLSLSKKKEYLSEKITTYRDNLKEFTVLLDDKPIFIIPSSSQDKDPTGSPLYSREKRAKIISKRIEKIADADPPINLKDLKVEEWKEGTTNIVQGVTEGLQAR